MLIVDRDLQSGIYCANEHRWYSKMVTERQEKKTSDRRSICPFFSVARLAYVEWLPKKKETRAATGAGFSVDLAAGSGK